jgi:hypothetical protein
LEFNIAGRYWYDRSFQTIAVWTKDQFIAWWTCSQTMNSIHNKKIRKNSRSRSSDDRFIRQQFIWFTSSLVYRFLPFGTQNVSLDGKLPCGRGFGRNALRILFYGLLFPNSIHWWELYLTSIKKLTVITFWFVKHILPAPTFSEQLTENRIDSVQFSISVFPNHRSCWIDLCFWYHLSPCHLEIDENFRTCRKVLRDWVFARCLHFWHCRKLRIIQWKNIIIRTVRYRRLDRSIGFWGMMVSDDHTFLPEGWISHTLSSASSDRPTESKPTVGRMRWLFQQSNAMLRRCDCSVNCWETVCDDCAGNNHYCTGILRRPQQAHELFIESLIKQQ